MRRIALTALVMGAGLAAYAQEVDSDDPGVPYWTRVETLSATGCIKTHDDGVCALFPAGTSRSHKLTVTVVKGSGDGECVWSQTSTSALAAGFQVNSLARGGRSISSSSPAHMRAHRQTMIDKGHDTIAGICPQPLEHGGDVLYAPCDENGDCTDFGGGNCRTTGVGAWEPVVGVFMICLPSSGSVDFTVTKEQVIK